MDVFLHLTSVNLGGFESVIQILPGFLTKTGTYFATFWFQQYNRILSANYKCTH